MPARTSYSKFSMCSARSRTADGSVNGTRSITPSGSISHWEQGKRSTHQLAFNACAIYAVRLSSQWRAQTIDGATPPPNARWFGLRPATGMRIVAGQVNALDQAHPTGPKVWPDMNAPMSGAVPEKPSVTPGTTIPALRAFEPLANATLRCPV